MRTAELAGRRVALWGFGREGRTTLAHLRAHLPALDIVLLNDQPPDDAPDDMPLVVGNGVPDALRNVDVVVKSPGISLYRPEIREARAQGTVFTSATQLFFDDLAARRADASPDELLERVVAITGTKGKSTTASLVAHLLRAAGTRVELRGNIGRPLLESIPDPSPEVWVVELSSYQTADLDAVPDVAVLLNLFPEHLDWHGDVETYFHDKLNLFRGQLHAEHGRAVIDQEDPETGRRIETFRQPLFWNVPNGFHVDADGAIRDGERGGAPVLDADAPFLLGRHNRSNACAALTTARALGLDTQPGAGALAEFRSLPHRLAPIGERDGVLWVDDSISTTPQSAMAAIESFPEAPLTVLLGGYDRRLDYDELARFLVARRVRAVVTLGQNGERIAEAVRAARGTAPRPRVLEKWDLESAVSAALLETPSGGVVLLSPAAPSYDQFTDFAERGRAFARAAGFSEPTDN